MENDEAKYWIIRKMTLTLEGYQLLNAILAVSDIELGKADCYVDSVTLQDNGDWTIELRGQE
jgi:hypothetical protein